MKIKKMELIGVDSIVCLCAPTSQEPISNNSTLPSLCSKT